MAIASIGTRGTAVSGASTTTIARAPTATVAVGRCLLAHFATRQDVAISTVTDAAGNTWEFLGRFSHVGTGNAHSEVWLCNVTTQLTTGTTITATFGSAVIDKCMALWEYSVGAGNSLRTVEPVVGNQVDAANGFGSAAFAGLPSLQRLYFRTGAKRANSTTTITATSGFTTHALNIRSRNNNANAIVLRAEHRINTSTGETSNPTMAVSGNTAAQFVALEEFTPVNEFDPLIADQAIFTLTGFDAGLTVQEPLQELDLLADQATYTLDGQAANTLVQRRLVADQQSYSLAGQAAGVVAARHLTADQQAYTLAGQAAGTLRSFWLTADQASYTLDGQAADVVLVLPPPAIQPEVGLAELALLELAGTIVPTADRDFAAETGNFASVGQTADLRVGRHITAEQASYTLQGQDAAFVRGYVLGADFAAYTAEGQAATLARALRVGADQATYSLAGQDATFARGLVLQAQTGAATFTGQDATLTAQRYISAEQGSYTATGQAADLRPAFKVLAGTGQLVFVPDYADPDYAEPGYAVSTAVGLVYARIMQADVASFDLVGQDANLVQAQSFNLQADTGAYTLTGFDAEFAVLQDRTLQAEAGSYTAAGQDAALRVNRHLSADTATAAAEGFVARLLAARWVPVDAGDLDLTAPDAGFALMRALQADQGVLALLGVPVGFISSNIAPAYFGTVRPAEERGTARPLDATLTVRGFEDRSADRPAPTAQAQRQAEDRQAEFA